MAKLRPVEQLAMLSCVMFIGGCGAAVPSGTPGNMPSSSSEASIPFETAGTPSKPVNTYQVQQYVGQIMTVRRYGMIIRFRWNGYRWVYLSQVPIYGGWWGDRWRYGRWGDRWTTRRRGDRWTTRRRAPDRRATTGRRT